MLPDISNSGVRQFYNIPDRKTYQIPVPQLHGTWCYGSSHGWLFIVDFTSGEINLLNPISRARIPLSRLSTFTDPPGLSKEQEERNVGYIERATVSENPSMSNNFVVMVIFTDSRVFAFCKPGDKIWTNLTKQGDHFEDVMYHKGNFYAITNWGALKVWDRCHIDAPVETVIPAPEHEECLRRYLVESPDGELLKVCRYTEWVVINDEDDDDNNDEGHSHTLKFEVFKLDEKEKTWVAVKILGDTAMFLGYNCGICLSAMKNPGFLANCIYFTDDNFEGYFQNPDGCYDMGIYSLADGRIKMLLLDPPFCSSPCIWISPNLL